MHLSLKLAFLGSLLTLPADASEWIMRPAESKIAIEGTQQSASFVGEFKEFTAKIVFDPADLSAASANVVVEMASFDSASAERDSNVGTTSWFSTKKFPEAKFDTKSFKDLGGGKYEVLADLTIKGVTKEVVLAMTLTIEGDVAKMSGTVDLDRTLFGVGDGEWSDSDWVGKAVKVTVTLVADRAPTP